MEPYNDERPGEGGIIPEWSNSWGDHSGGNSSGGYWAGSISDDVSTVPQWQGKGSLTHLRSAGNTLLRHNGFLLRGTMPCTLPPPLLITGLEAKDQAHYSCLCFRWAGKLLPLKKSGKWYYHYLHIPLPEGTYTLNGKWQSGHYNYSEIFQVRIFLFGMDMGYVKLPLLKYTEIAVITKTATELTVNNFKGSYRGNDKFVENNQ